MNLNIINKRLKWLISNVKEGKIHFRSYKFKNVLHFYDYLSVTFKKVFKSQPA